MAHNKGKRYIFCRECNRNRYCKHEPAPNYHRKWTCSKGHSWVVPLPNLERLNKILLENLTPKIKDFFERDDVFYSKIRR